MARQPFLLWHRWFGLIGGMWLFLLAATGSFIVFVYEIDRALNPDLHDVAIGRQVQPVGMLVAELEKSRPGWYVDFFIMPEGPDRSAQAFLARQRKAGDPPLTDDDFRQFYIDPYTATILGDRQWGEAGLDRRRFALFIYQLHKDVLLGPWMVWLLGLLALLWIVDHVIAVMLSFSNAAKWARSFIIRRRVRGHKRIFDLHRAVGLWLFPVTLVLAVTGIAFNWPSEWRTALNIISVPGPDIMVGVEQLPTPILKPSIPVDSAIATAERRMGAKVLSISWLPDTGVWRMGAEKSVVTIDHFGTIIGHYGPDDETTQDIINAWVYPLHSGKAFGWPGRIVIFLTGIAICMFVITGFMIWWRKRSARSYHPLHYSATLQPAR